jgi:TATA-box binding protein (TBP) (component of TFIID and TFIIIB)
MTMVVQIPGKQINTKVFKNGKVQVSGVKSLLQAQTAVETFISKVKNITGTNEVKLHRDPVTGLVCDVDGNIYKQTQKIGTVSVSGTALSISLCGKDVESYDGNKFRTKEYTNRERQIYDQNGDLIGYSTIDFIRKKKNFSLKNTEIRDSVLFSKWGNELGKEVIQYYDPDYVFVAERFESTIQVPFAVLSNIPTPDIHIVNINANVSVFLDSDTPITPGIPGIPVTINRVNMWNLLKNQGIWTDYDPCGYPGVKAAFFVKSDGTIGSCPHSQTTDTKSKTHGRKCEECLRVSVVFFQSSKILISGCRSLEQLESVTSKVSEIVHEHFDEITVKPKSVNPTQQSSKKISIYDLI